MTYQLYDYQKQLINKARTHIRDKNVMIVSPPGSGKSVVIADIAKKAVDKGGRVLFVVHRKELIEQITHSFKTHGVDLSKVNLLTVIKAKNRLGTLPKPTLIITDEGHHGRASTYKAIYDYFADVPRLGFTATPWRMSGDGFTDIYDVMVEGQTVQWLIENKRLAPYLYYSIPSIDVNKLKIKNGEYSNQSIDDALGATIFGDVIEEYTKHADGQQAILYAHSVEASKKFAQEFQQAGISAVHADSKTRKTEREDIMQRFRDGDIKVLCNVDLISEGFDVPDCSVTILCRPTKSLVLFLQQSMRSMRYRKDKTAVIIDNVMNWRTHGLPDDNHDWNKYFKGGWKKKGNANEITAKECPVCSALCHINVLECPVCGHSFEEAEKREKRRLQAELELIKREQLETERIANKKFNKDLKNNWEIAQARAKVKGGKPLYKLIYFYLSADWVSTTVEELQAVTGNSVQQINQAKHWLQNKKRGN